MDQPRPAYVVGSPGALRDRVMARLDPDGMTVVTDPATFPDEGSPGVVLLLAEGLEGDAVLELLHRLATGNGEWTPCLVRERGGEVEVRTLSVGWREDLDAVVSFRNGDDDRLLELRRAAERMSRSRHDINNPLTSGMAETQLLLMDVEDPEARAALGTIQTQLRRIRDLVAATKGIRSGAD